MARKKGKQRTKRGKHVRSAGIIPVLPKIFLMFFIGLVISSHSPRLMPNTGFAASMPVLQAKPYESSHAVGDKFIVNIEVDSMKSLYAYQTDILYNPAVLRLDKVQQGTFLSKEFADTVLYNAPDTSVPGVIKHAVESRTGVGDATGSGTLLKLTFTVIGAGESKILFDHVKLLDAGGGEIPIILSQAVIHGLELPKTCMQLEGVACGSAAACTGMLLGASDVAYCCNRQCVSARNAEASAHFTIYKLELDDQLLYRQNEQREVTAEKKIPFDLAITVQNQGTAPEQLHATLALPSYARLLSMSPGSAEVTPGGFQVFHALVETSSSFTGTAAVVGRKSKATAPFTVLVEHQQPVIVPERPSGNPPSWHVLLFIIGCLLVAGFAWKGRLFQSMLVRSTNITDASYLRQLVKFRIAGRYKKVYLIEPYADYYATAFDSLQLLTLSKQDMKKARELTRRFGVSTKLAKMVAASLRRPSPRILTAERVPPRLQEEYPGIRFVNAVQE